MTLLPFSRSIKRPEDGAAVVFEGIVRNHTRGRRTLYLDYEAYEEMALKQMEELAARALAEYKIRDVAMVHRLGRLEIGETSVLIVVASAHRAAAFDACRWLIDTLKRTVPIWKKEHFEDGAVWADGEPFPGRFRLPKAPIPRGVHLSDQPVWLHSSRFLSAISVPPSKRGFLSQGFRRAAPGECSEVPQLSR